MKKKKKKKNIGGGGLKVVKILVQNIHHLYFNETKYKQSILNVNYKGKTQTDWNLMGEKSCKRHI